MDKPSISKLAIAGLIVLAIIIIAGFIFGFNRLFIIFILLPFIGMIRLKRIREVEQKHGSTLSDDIMYTPLLQLTTSMLS